MFRGFVVDAVAVAILTCALWGVESFSVPVTRGTSSSTSSSLALVPSQSIRSFIQGVGGNREEDGGKNEEEEITEVVDTGNSKWIGQQFVVAPSEEESGDVVAPAFEEDESSVEKQERFIQEGLDQFAQDLESFGTVNNGAGTDADDDDDVNEEKLAVVNELVSNTTARLEEELSKLRDSYALETLRLQDQLEREQTERWLEKKRITDELQSLRDAASRDQSHAMNEQLKLDAARFQLERRLEDQTEQLQSMQKRLVVANHDVSELKARVNELEQERSNVFSLTRQSVRVIRTGVSARLRRLFGRSSSSSSSAAGGGATSAIASSSASSASSSQSDNGAPRAMSRNRRFQFKRKTSNDKDDENTSEKETPGIIEIEGGDDAKK
mmetsp:Transcript_9824/g.16413  ORF Transcript_9824/g.16413 Transcript_9824/m.16413 type:complete len:383 (-) Transcript_9824:251-1399(-)